MEHNADTNVVDDNLETPLIAACRTGHVDCLQPLLSNQHSKPNVNATDATDNTAAMLASKNGHAQCLKLILANEELDLALTNEKGDTALMLAAENDQLECAQLLLERGADPDARNVRANGRTALHQACIKGHAEMTQLLLQFDADVDITFAHGMTPLHCAAVRNHAGCVQHLLEAKADANLGDNEEITAVMMASAKGGPESLLLLLKAGANVNALDIYNGSCLRLACIGKKWDNVEMLLAHGAFVKHVFTVHYACAEFPAICDQYTAWFYGAGGHNYVGVDEREQEGLRKADREVREKFIKDGGILPLATLLKDYMWNFFEKNYPGTNLFPLVKALPVPFGLKGILLNGVSPPEMDVPLDRALRVTSYPTPPLICAHCLRSRAELKAIGRSLEVCSCCQIVAYCHQDCRRDHWALSHAATCEKGTELHTVSRCIVALTPLLTGIGRCTWSTGSEPKGPRF